MGHDCKGSAQVIAVGAVARGYHERKVAQVGRFICGIFGDRAQAQKVIRALIDSGISSRQISLAVREPRSEDVGRRDEAEETPTPFTGVSLSSAWERVGWQNSALPPYRTKIAPDVTEVILMAGPMAISLGGPQVGATGGGLVGSVANFGFPLELARDYERRIHEGAALVMVSVNDAQMAPVRGTLDSFQGEVIATARRSLD
jgi:hypothetical protein